MSVCVSVCRLKMAEMPLNILRPSFCVEGDDDDEHLEKDEHKLEKIEKFDTNL